MSLSVHHVDAHHAIFSFHNVFVWQCRTKPTVADMERAHNLQLALLERYPKGTGFLLRVPAGSPMPDMDARARATTMFRDLAPHMHACITVFEGTGFWASAARSVMAGITAVMRGKFAVKVFGDLDQAVLFLTEELQSHGAKFSKAELTEIVDKHWNEMASLEDGESKSWR